MLRSICVTQAVRNYVENVCALAQINRLTSKRICSRLCWCTMFVCDVVSFAPRRFLSNLFWSICFVPRKPPNGSPSSYHSWVWVWRHPTQPNKQAARKHQTLSRHAWCIPMCRWCHLCFPHRHQHWWLCHYTKQLSLRWWWENASQSLLYLVCAQTFHSNEGGWYLFSRKSWKISYRIYNDVPGMFRSCAPTHGNSRPCCYPTNGDATCTWRFTDLLGCTRPVLSGNAHFIQYSRGQTGLFKCLLTSTDSLSKTHVCRNYCSIVWKYYSTWMWRPIGNTHWWYIVLNCLSPRLCDTYASTPALFARQTRIHF